MKRILLLGGKFDYNGGRYSKIFQTIEKTVSQYAFERKWLVYSINGGYFQKLIDLQKDINEYDVAVWFADVPNDCVKIIKDLKKKNKKLLLISSKNNVDEKYSINDLIQHALGNKSNLFVEFTKNNNNRYQARVLDPLGNQFGPLTEDVSQITKIMLSRIVDLLDFTRIGSQNIGPALDVPDDTEFFEIIRKHANTFHKLIYGTDNIERFLGNSSFRCINGFPSMRNQHNIFVTRRNLDKSLLGQNGFVAVTNNEDVVQYCGENKPSVDTPIQIRLYNYYNQVKYILHSHVYVQNAAFTQRIIPCGAIEEFDEIIKIYNDNASVNFSINLLGHGSLVLANNIDYIKNIIYISRNMPELHIVENKDESN